MKELDPPVFIFTESEALEYFEANKLHHSRSDGRAESLRERLIAGMRSLVGGSYQHPEQPSNPEKPNAPWGFLWDDISKATGGHVSWEVARKFLDRAGEVEWYFEPTWLSAYFVRPQGISRPELEEADAYLFDPLGKWIIAIDHEGYGPFLLPLRDRERLLKLVHPIWFWVVDNED